MVEQVDRRQVRVGDPTRVQGSPKTAEGEIGHG